MKFRLRTVKQKLFVLVLLSAGVMLAALPVLSWLLHRQMIDEVDDRVTDAEDSFEAELTDDLADIELAARVLAQDAEVVKSLSSGDATGARRVLSIFERVYPGIDVLAVNARGDVVTQIGCSAPPSNVRSAPEFARVLSGAETQQVVLHGCEAEGGHAPPAAVFAVPVLASGGGAGGAIIVCLPLDDAYLTNAGAKLGLQLALSYGNVAVAETKAFPAGGLSAAPIRRTALLENGSHAWAVARFEPARFGSIPGFGAVAALDVTDVRTLIRHNLLFALGFLAFAASVSVAFGARLASIMSRALARVSAALKRLEEQEYVHVEVMQTGDELEHLASGFNAMVDGLKERDKLKTTMGKYMTASVMEHLMGGTLKLGGESIRVTILFTDIRSFTTMSERMPPQEVVSLLNEYFGEMVTIVMNEDGVVDKYIGDAIMAVFGAPVPKPDDALHAVRAAVKMRVALEHLNVRLAERGIPPIHTGIGIHTGEVVAGNIGSERRMEYTVIGDAVNLASRLEGSTKELGVNVAISEDTWKLTEHAIVARKLREIIVKGRAQPVMTYELVDLQPEAGISKAR